MDFSALNTFDYIVLTIVGLSTLFAFFRGFIQTVMSFLAWIGSIFITVYLFPHVQPLVAQHIENPIAANTVAFLGTYFALLIGFIILGLQLLYIAQALRFGPIDRALGFAFGLLRGVVLVTVVFMLITLFYSLFSSEEEGGIQEAELPDWLTKAQTYGLLQQSAAKTIQLAPDSLWDDVRGFAKKFNNPTQFATWAPTPQIIKTVDTMVEAIPEEERKTIFRKYGLPFDLTTSEGEISLDGDESIQLSPDALPIKNFEFSRDIFHAYQEALKNGKIRTNVELSEETLEKLEKVFSVVEPSVQNLLKAQGATGDHRRNAQADTAAGVE